MPKTRQVSDVKAVLGTCSEAGQESRPMNASGEATSLVNCCRLTSEGVLACFATFFQLTKTVIERLQRYP